MKGLRKYLTPFAPDQSGAVSVLYDLGGIIVICDAGGCTGNICGFDEPRWFETSSAVFSAGLRDMDAILGRDDKLVEKLAMAAKAIDANFAAIIGTPVPATIGTDYRALKRLAEKKINLPIITVETTGMNLYDFGAERALESVFKTFATEQTETIPGRIGVLGASPLDLAGDHPEQKLKDKLLQEGASQVVIYGMGATLEDIKKAASAEKNLVVSPAGLRAAEYLKKTFHTEYEIRCPLAEELVPEEDFSGKKVLCVHQQVMANSMRDRIRSLGGEDVTVATWFMRKPALAEPQDRFLVEEDEFEELVENGQFDCILADRTLQPIVRNYPGTWIHAPHFAVSGKLGDDA